MKLTFFGAARGHRQLSLPGGQRQKILIDCGLQQGRTSTMKMRWISRPATSTTSL